MRTSVTFFFAICASTACKSRDFHGTDLAQTTGSRDAAWGEAPPARSPLFRQKEPIEVAIEAPLKTLFEHKFDAGLGREEFSVDAKVTAAGQTHAAKLRVRGNTSIGECAFPKLKLKLADAPEASPFHKAKSIKIGTHCSDEDDSSVSNLGRLSNEKSPWREAFLYDAMAISEVPALGVRRARITYRDTSGGAPIVRNAFFLEDIDSLADRYGGKEYDDEKNGPWGGNGIQAVGATNLARLHFAEALLGNWDWAFPLGTDSGDHEGPTWNVKVVTLPTGGILPVPFDFDMASGVSGATKLDQTLTPEFFEGRSSIFRQAAASLLDARVTYGKEAVAKAAAHFQSKKDALFSSPASSAMDEKGRALLREHMEAFFEALKPENLWMPMVESHDTELYSNEELTENESCQLSRGTPVAILERKGTALRIRTLRTECRETEGWVKAENLAGGNP